MRFWYQAQDMSFIHFSILLVDKLLKAAFLIKKVPNQKHTHHHKRKNVSVHQFASQDHQTQEKQHFSNIYIQKRYETQFHQSKKTAQLTVKKVTPSNFHLKIQVSKLAPSIFLVISISGLKLPKALKLQKQFFWSLIAKINQNFRRQQKSFTIS